MDRKQLLHLQKHNDKQCVPFSVTYRCSLPNLKGILTKYWQILKTNQSCRKPFSTLTVIAFRKCTRQDHIFVTNTIHDNEKVIKTKNEHYTGKFNPKVVFSFNNLCQQKHSKSNRTNKTFKIYHKVNCKSQLRYLLTLLDLKTIEMISKIPM